MAHDLLVSQDWRGASMHDLVRAQIAYCLDVAAGRRVVDTRRIDGPKIMLKPEAAQNIGLALHELATNALAHGAPVAAGRRRRADWRFEDGGSFVEWRESGGPAVATPPREGFGHKVHQATGRAGARRDGDAQLSARGIDLDAVDSGELRDRQGRAGVAPRCAQNAS